MKQNAKKIAALAMLSPDGAEERRLEEELPRILALAQMLPLGAESEEDFALAQTPDALRVDRVEQTVSPERVRALSKNEKDGYLHVVRTVG